MRMTNLNRRAFVISSVLGGVATLLPRSRLAASKPDARFVLVILRGALDGLAAVPAYGDGNYAGKRGALAITVAISEAGWNVRASSGDDQSVSALSRATS